MRLVKNRCRVLCGYIVLSYPESRKVICEVMTNIYIYILFMYKCTIKKKKISYDTYSFYSSEDVVKLFLNSIS